MAYEYFYPIEEDKQKSLRDAVSKKEFMKRCPACGMVGEIITKVHCQTQHNMTREELIEQYGEIKTWRQYKTEQMKLRGEING